MINLTFQMLYLKNFHSFVLWCPHFALKISKSIKELDVGVYVFDTLGGTGVQVSFKESLMLNIKPLEANQPDLETLNIKFTGDGTWGGKRLLIVNFWWGYMGR